MYRRYIHLFNYNFVVCHIPQNSTITIKLFLDCLVLVLEEVMNTLDIQRNLKKRDIIRPPNIREIILKEEGFTSSL